MSDLYTTIKEDELHKKWSELLKRVHHTFEYGLHCNDLSYGEIESDISFALDEFGKVLGMPEYDWDQDYETVYSEQND